MCIGAVTGMMTSCATSICASMTCCACSKAMGAMSTATRVVYGLMLFTATAVSALMMTGAVSVWLNSQFADRWFSGIPGIPDPANSIPPETIGAVAVYRVMFGVFLFHSFLSLCLVGVANSTDKRAKLQNEFWCLKWPLLVGIIIAMFFVPTDFFESAVDWFKVGGCLFIFVQLMFLCAFSFDMYEGLLALGEAEEESGEGRRCIWWNWFTILSTLSFYAFCIFVFVVVVIVHTNHDEGCWVGVMASGINLLLMLIVSGVSVSSFVRDATNGPGHLNGVFQSGMVSAYACYQVLSAMLNSPDAHACSIQSLEGLTDCPDPAACQAVCEAGDGTWEVSDWGLECHVLGMYGGSGLSKTMGLVFAFIAVLWSAIRSGSNKFFASADDGGDTEAPLLATEGEDGEEGGGKADDERQEVTYSYSQFHVMFALAAMYIAMLLTQWGFVDTHSGEGQAVSLRLQDSSGSVWIKIVASWLCFVIYGWAMLAPPMMPDRDFT